jgi:hypothetical protein
MGKVREDGADRARFDGGQSALAEMGFGEEAHGHNAIAAGFQGQRQWTDYQPNGDFMEAILNTSFDWNGIRSPYIVATENDCVQRRGNAVGLSAHEHRADFCRCADVLEPRGGEARLRHKLTGAAAGGILHLINSGPATLDGTGQQSPRRPAGDETVLGNHEGGGKNVSTATTWHPSITEYFPGGGWSTRFLTKGGMPVTMCRLNLVKGLGPALQIAEGWTWICRQKSQYAGSAHQPTWPTTWFAPTTGRGAFRDVYTVMNNWGANHGAISYGHVGADLISSRRCCASRFTCTMSQRNACSVPARGRHSARRTWKRGLSRLQKLRPALLTDRWQKFTELAITSETLRKLAESCAEFLVHAVDMEGLCRGIDRELVEKLGRWTPIPATYAGGANSLADLEAVTKLGQGKIDLTIGSALDIFGGSSVKYDDCVKFNRLHSASQGGVVP